MRAAPIRFLFAAAWPLSIWASLTHLEEHPADDYVERTSPIVATAIAFWICLAMLIMFATPVVTTISAGIEGQEALAAQVRRVPGTISSVLWAFAPALYVIGFWLYTARDEAFPR